MHTRQFCLRLITTTLFAFSMFSSISYAGMVDLMLFGETTSASNENSFGLSAGDQVSFKATFDYSSLSGTGAESINFTQASGNSLSFFMGDLTFSTDNYGNFSLGFPVINFVDGIYSGIDYIAYTGVNGSPENLFSNGYNWGSIVSGQNNNSGLSSSLGSSEWVTGTWDNESATIKNNSTPDIPEPAPLILAAIGILGAWISSRRRKSLA